MTVFERIQELAKNQGKSVKQISKELGFGESTIYKWKIQSPKIEYLEKVAAKLNTTTDYLIGKSDNPNIKENLLDESENDLIAAFRLESNNMSPEEKKKFNQSLKGMMRIAKGLLQDDSNWKE
ncbi:helix-turn-helix domain-containing protein [Enterococcus alishanensis]